MLPLGDIVFPLRHGTAFRHFTGIPIYRHLTALIFLACYLLKPVSLYLVRDRGRN